MLPAVTQPRRGRGLGRHSVHPYLALTSVEGTGSQKITAAGPELGSGLPTKATCCEQCPKDILWPNLHARGRVGL